MEGGDVVAINKYICFKSYNKIKTSLSLTLYTHNVYFSFLLRLFDDVGWAQRLTRRTHTQLHICHYKDADNKRQLTVAAGIMSAFEMFCIIVYLILVQIFFNPIQFMDMYDCWFYFNFFSIMIYIVRVCCSTPTVYSVLQFSIAFY